MTKSDEQNCQRVVRHQLTLLRSCLKLAQTKTGLLMRHDLSGLEAILVREAEVMEQLNEAQGISVAAEIQPCDEVSAEWISLKSEISAIAREIQHVNQTNARLIENGRQFCEVLYAAICPPQTYSPSLSLTSRPVESTFQAQY
jgi:flagellar FlgN protein